MNINMFIQNGEPSKCVPGKINTNLQSKIRDTNTRDERSSKLVPSLSTQSGWYGGYNSSAMCGVAFVTTAQLHSTNP